MFFNQQQAFSLGNCCDYVIYLRNEILSNKQEITTLADSIVNSENNNVYIPQGFDYLGTNDQLAFGVYSVMEKYCSLYSKLNYYADFINNQKAPIAPELLLKIHLHYSQVYVKRIPFVYILNPFRPYLNVFS